MCYHRTSLWSHQSLPHPWCLESVIKQYKSLRSAFSFCITFLKRIQSSSFINYYCIVLSTWKLFIYLYLFSTVPPSTMPSASLSWFPYSTLSAVCLNSFTMPHIKCHFVFASRAKDYAHFSVFSSSYAVPQVWEVHSGWVWADEWWSSKIISLARLWSR